MSTQQLPVLGGITFPAKRTTNWKTRKQVSISGKETALADWQSPRWTWEVPYSTLKQSGTSVEFATLAGFYNQMLGGFDSFLYTDAFDNAVTGQSLGAGTGAQAAFPFLRTFGGATQPALAPNVVSAVYLAGVSTPAAGISPPSTPSLSQVASGSLAATTYFAKITWVTNSGETLPSSESSLAVSLNNVLKIAAPASPPAQAIGWNAYVSNTAGGGTGAETRQNGSTPIALGTPWQEPNTGLVAGAALPLVNSTGWSFTQWGATVPGVLTFQGNVVIGIAVTADFTYFWPCRFIADACEFDQFDAFRYECKKLAWISIK